DTCRGDRLHRRGSGCLTLVAVAPRLRRLHPGVPTLRTGEALARGCGEPVGARSRGHHLPGLSPDLSPAERSVIRGLAPKICHSGVVCWCYGMGEDINCRSPTAPGFG